MLDPHLHKLGEQMFFLFSPYMEKEEAEKLSSEILLLLLEDRKSTYDSFIWHCGRIKERVNENFKKHDSVFSESFIKGSEHAINFFEYVFNNRVNLDKDQMIEILKIMKQHDNK